MSFEVSGFRDLVSEFDCLRFEARAGRLSIESFGEGVKALLRRAEASLDPRVHRFLMPALLASAPPAGAVDPGVLLVKGKLETAEHQIPSAPR